MSRIYEALKRVPPAESTAVVPRTGGAGRFRSLPSPDPGPPVGDEEVLDARRLLWGLYQRKWQILLVTLMVVAPVMVATMLQERLYESSTLIEVAEPVQVLPYRDVTTSTASGFSTLGNMASQEEMLRGSVVAGRVAQRLKADPDAQGVSREIPRLGGHVAVVPLPNSQMIRIGYLAWRPDVAAKIANLWAEEFIKASFVSRQETREKARQLLKRELATLEEQVQASEQQLVKYAKEHGMQRDQNGSGDLAQTKLVSLAGEVTVAETELIDAQSRLDSLKNASLDNFPQKLITSGITERQLAISLLEHDLTGLRVTFGEKWPAVVQKRTELEAVRQQLRREKSDALALARQQALLEYNTAEAKLRMLTESKAQQERFVGQLRDASVQYNIIRREVETNQKLYEGLLERLKQTGVAQGMEIENIRVIEPAWPSSTASRPRVLWNFLLATLAGLALGLCGAFAMDFWHNAISSVEDVESATRLPLLGTVPQVALSGQARGILPRLAEVGSRNGREAESTSLVAGEPDASSGEPLARKFMADPGVAESVRSICASILLSQSEHPPRVLLVTSALPGEGKTTIAGQLGLALADSGCRTLLVECDMRRPSLGKTLGIGTESGLSLFLAGHVDLPRFQRVIDDKLVVVSAGPPAPNPVALLHSEKMRAFVSEMTRSFRFVILDAPPVLPMADARMLGALAEGVVLVVRAGVTSKKDVQRACAALASAGSSLLGTILNGASLDGPDSSYYRYYRQYYEG